MPTIRDNAICIRRWDFSETSQTVSLFTRNHGVLRGLAKGAKRDRGSFSGGLDVLTRGQVIAILKPDRDLATLTEWNLESVCWPVRQRLDANRAGLYMADLIHHMLTQHDPHPALFDRFTEALDGLDDPAHVQPSLLRFHWALLTETGYQPEVTRNAETGRPLPDDCPTMAFSALAGGLVEDTASGDRWRVRIETAHVLQQLASDNPLGAVMPDVTRRANRLLSAYCRELMGQEPPAMRWAFPELSAGHVPPSGTERSSRDVT